LVVEYNEPTGRSHEVEIVESQVLRRSVLFFLGQEGWNIGVMLDDVIEFGVQFSGAFIKVTFDKSLDRFAQWWIEDCRHNSRDDDP
jgi:hypothetical protein